MIGIRFLMFFNFQIVKSKSFFIALLLFTFVPFSQGWAKPTTDSQARQVVIAWLSLDKQPLGTALGQQVREVQTFRDNSGSPQYYVVYLNPAGFVIVSGDDLVEPIIGFVRQGLFDPSPRNPLGALVSRDVPARVAEATGLMRSAEARGQVFAPVGRQQKALQKWNFLQGSSSAITGEAVENSRMTAISDVRVPPLVTTKWNQEKDNADSGPCYNYYTEWDDIYYPCGCVATAMAQLMRSRTWPQSGVGTASFDITVDGVPLKESLLGGNGSGGAYDWDNMIDDPKKGATTEQRQAIGSLTHDAGVAVNMQYTSTEEGSEAKTSDAAKALVKTFGYGNAKFGNNTWNIPLPNLYNMINPNLDAGLSVIIGTTDHLINCDGYGYNTFSLYHHLNLGWGGLEDAWYNLPTIDTQTQTTYKTIGECIYNIYNSGTGEIISGRVVDGQNNPVSGALVTATLSGGGTRTTNSNSRGIYALSNLPSASSFTITTSCPGLRAFNTQKVSTGTSADNDIVCGNLWGIDLAGTRNMPVPPLQLLLLD